MVMAEPRDISVEAEIPAQLHALVDAARLSQALLNLLDNAVKYNRRGGHVSLRAERSRNTRANSTILSSPAASSFLDLRASVLRTWESRAAM